MLPKLSACWTLGEAGFHQLCDVSMLNSSFSLPAPWPLPLLVTQRNVTFQCSLDVRHNVSPIRCSKVCATQKDQPKSQAIAAYFFPLIFTQFFCSIERTYCFIILEPTEPLCKTLPRLPAYPFQLRCTKMLHGLYCFPGAAEEFSLRTQITA